MKTPPTQTSIEGAPDKANSNSKNILQRHFCYCRPGNSCLFCLQDNPNALQIGSTNVVRELAS
jgi:hypothetical protein